MYPRSTLLVAAIAGTIVTTLSVQAWTLVQGRERALASVEVRAANRAQATLDGVRSVMARIDLELLQVRDQLKAEELLTARGPATGARAERVAATLRRHLDRVAQQSHIHVVGASGDIIYSTMVPVPRVNVADRPYFREQRAAVDDALRVSQLHVGRASGTWGIHPNRRITTADGRFAGIVQAVLEPGTLDRELKAIDQSDWTLALFDRAQQLVGSAPAMPNRIGQVFGDEVIRGAAAEGQARSRGAGLGFETPTLWAAHNDRELQLTTVAGYAQDRALAQWRRDVQIHLAVAALLVAAWLVALVLHARHRRSAHSMRSLHERLKLAASEVHLGVWEVEGDRVQVDEAMAELHRQGADAARWTRARWLELVAPHDRRRLARAIEDARRSPGRFEVQVQLDGTLERHLRIAGVGVVEGTPARPRVHGIAWDVTEVERAHRALTQAQKLDALGHLAGGVAHDFNNMLAAILSSAALLSEALEAADHRELVETITTAARRAADLTQKLLAFARKSQVISEEVDVHQIIGETRAILARTIDRRITVSAALDAPRCTIRGDPSQLQSALLNLGVNARDAMPNGGALRFSTALRRLHGGERRQGAFELEEGDYLVVDVTDTGSGISEDVLPHVFDPYFTTKAVGKGTGLGLAAVFGTMAAHHGAVTVTSEVGMGTRFRLYLPLCEARPPEVTAPAPARTARPVRGKVLVVDDEEVVRASTAALLRALGHEPLTAADPDEAVRLFRLHHRELDLALLDVVLAARTGLELAAELRAVDAGVPLVLMSGFTRTEALGELAARGLAGFLQKPFARADVERLLAEVLEASPRPAPAPAR